MNIEFYTPSGQVREGIINFMRERLYDLKKRNKKIVRAEVYFRSHDTQKVCEIDLSISDNSLLVQRQAESFDKAAHDAVQELNSKIEGQAEINSR